MVCLESEQNQFEGKYKPAKSESDVKSNSDAVESKENTAAKTSSDKLAEPEEAPSDNLAEPGDKPEAPSDKLAEPEDKPEKSGDKLAEPGDKPEKSAPPIIPVGALHLANAGNVRALLVRADIAHELSRLHMPSNPKERQRVVKAGACSNMWGCASRHCSLSRGRNQLTTFR